jgi:hypothetical protein
LLGAIAALPVAPARVGAQPPPDGFVSVIDDKGRTWFKAVSEDSVFAAIYPHKQAAAAWDAAVDVRSNFSDFT